MFRISFLFFGLTIFFGHSFAQGKRGVTLHFDKKIKGDFNIRYSYGQDNWGRFSFSEKSLIDTAFLEDIHITPHLKFYIEQDNEIINDTSKIEELVGRNVYINIKNYKVINGDTINRTDKDWMKQGLWIKEPFGQGLYINNLKEGNFIFILL